MRFIVLGDLHYSYYPTPALRQTCDEYYENLFNSVLEQGPDAVFAIGDTVDNGLPEEFEGLHSCAKKVGLSFYTVNGNHDLLRLTKEQVACWTGNANPYYSLYYNPVRGESVAEDPDASAFVVLDTPKERNAKDHGGYLGKAQLEWLKDRVEKSARSPLFVFGHHPLRGATLYSSLKMLNIDNSREVWPLLQARRESPAFYFCGHNHANSISRRGNWYFVQTSAPLRTNDYRVIDFYPEEVVVRSVRLAEKGQRKLARQLVKAMGDFLQLPARGFPPDRYLRVTTGKQPRVLPEEALSF